MYKKINKIIMVLLLGGMFFLTGCTTPETTEKELYAVGRLIHNVDDNTPAVIELSPEDYGVYDFIYDFPGHSPGNYTGLSYFISPNDFIASSKIIPVAAPFTQTVYFYGNDPAVANYKKNFSLDRSVSLSYVVGSIFGEGGEKISDYPPYSINPVSGEKKEFSFGKSYIPTSVFINSNTYIELKDRLIRGHNSFVVKNTNITSFVDGGIVYTSLEKPKFDIFENNINIHNGSLVDLNGAWDYRRLFYFIKDNKNYTVNISIPLYYPIFNKTLISAEFSTYDDFIALPRLKNLEIDTSFEQGEVLDIRVIGESESRSPDINGWYKNRSSNWIPINWIDYSGECGVLCNATRVGDLIAMGEEIHLKISLNDTAENKQTYIIKPVSIHKKDLQITITQSPSELYPATETTSFGSITDGNREISSLLISIVYNGKEIKRAFTNEGKFDFKFEVPAEFREGDNLSMVYGGAGIYPKKEHILSGDVQILEKDYAVLDIIKPPVLYVGRNNLTVEIANVGNSTTEARLNLYYGCVFCQPILAGSKTVNLSAGEIKEEELEINIKGENVPRNKEIEIIAEILLENDGNLLNNKKKIRQEVVADTDAAIDINIKDTFHIVNETIQATVKVSNEGLEPLSNINYSVEYYKDELLSQSPVEIDSGFIDFLDEGETMIKTVEFTINEQGVYSIRGIANATNDMIPSNNLHEVFIRVDPSGADLNGWLSTGNLIVNETTNLTLTISNYGNEIANNATAEIYYKYGICGSDCNLSLLDFRNLRQIQSYTSVNERFEFTPSQTGDLTLRIVLNATNEIAPENNIFTYYYKIKESGPDILARVNYFELSNTNFVLGQETNISATLGNIGDKEARNISLSLYRLNKSSKDLSNIFIDNAIFANILPDGIEKTILTITPEEKRYTYLFLNASLANDTNLDNNHDYATIFVLNNGTDVSLDYVGHRTIAVVNRSFILNVGLRNVGNQFVEAGTFVYFDNDLIANQTTSLPSGDFNALGVSFIPGETGEKELRVVAEAEGDIDLSDNVYSASVMVHNVKNTTFNFVDSRGNNVSRYIENNIGQKIINGSDVFEVIDGENRLTIGKIFGNSGVAIFLDGVFFSDTETIVSEYYESLEQNRTIYSVFANRFGFNYSSAELYQALFNLSYIESIGINTNYLEEYTLFYCETFSFSEKQCEEDWTEAETVNSILPQTGFHLNAGNNGAEIEAFGVSESSEFSGATTNFSNISGDTALNPVIEKILHGKIEFKGEVNIARIKENIDLLKQNVEIRHKRIKIDTDNLPEFGGIPAVLLFRNIDFRNPLVVQDGAVCPDSTCTGIEHNAGARTVSVDVTGFSSFEIIEGPYCGDNICQEDSESCSTCSADCGACEEDSGDDTDAPNTGTPDTSCTANWTCSWGPCQDNVQKYLCTDANNCGTNVGKPPEATKICLTNSDCVDIDGDGYGQGVDCLGFDYDDEDPAINAFPRGQTQDDDDRTREILIIIGGVLFFVIIVIIFFVVLARIK